jgi:hypothetical protein
MPATGNALIGILAGRNHPRDACCKQGFGARACLSLVGAGLKRDIGRGTPGEHSRLAQRFGLGMWPATILRPALSGNRAAGINDHASDGRVRPHAPKTALCQPQGQTHVPFVCVR